MSGMTNSEDRLLAMSERELVEMTRPPGIDALSVAELQALAKRIRSVRDRARRIASQQQREMRGKAEPRGAVAAADNTGSLGKTDVLAEAAKRVSATLRQRKAPVKPKPTQGDIGHKLMEMKLAAEAAAQGGAHPGPGRTASGGMQAKVNAKPTVTMDPREVGRVSKATKTAQAKRDKR